MADLPIGAFSLSVQVNSRVGHACHQMVGALIHRHLGRLWCAEDVGHHGDLGARRGVAERVVENGPEVLFELRRDRAVHRPVATVVRTHRELVDQQLAVDGLEEFHRHHTDDAEFGCQPQRHLLCAFGGLGAQIRCGGDDHRALSPTLHGLDHRPCATLPERRARDHRRQFAAHLHLFLGDQIDAGSELLVEHRECVRPVVDDPHATSVVSAAYGLQHDVPAVPFTEFDESAASQSEVTCEVGEIGYK